MEGNEGDRVYEGMSKKEAKARPAQLGECQGFTKSQRREAVRNDFVLKNKKQKAADLSSRGLGAQPGIMEGPGDERRGLW